MKNFKTLSRFAVAAGAGLVLAHSANAFTLDPGVGCPFALDVSGGGIKHQIVRKDRQGEIIWTKDVGESIPVTLTNVGTGASFTIPQRGGTYTTEVNQAGETMVTTTGHIVLLWFPADQPTGPGSAGPDTTYYQGKVTFRINPDGTWTYLSSSGRQTDICDLLS